MEDTTKNKAI